MDHLSPLVGMLSNMQVFIISLLLFIMFRREVKPQPIDTPSPTLHFVCNGFFFSHFELYIFSSFSMITSDPMGHFRYIMSWGVSGPVVRALDSGSDGPGSSPGWGTTLWP